MKKQIALFLVCLCCFNACAVWQRHGVVLKPPQKLSIAVLPVRNAVHIKKLKQLETRPKGEEPPGDEKNLAEEKMRQVTAQMTKLLGERLQDSYFFEVAPPERVEAVLKNLGEPGSKGPLSKTQAKQIGEKLHVPAILTLRLDGYGKIRPSWVVLLLISSAIEATSHGVIAAVATGNTALAAGLAAGEMAHETAIWGGGTLFFNKLFTPVILEAKLWSTVDGGELWHKTVIAIARHKTLKKLSKPEQKKRKIRLQLSYDRAQALIVKSLAKAAARNMHSDSE